MFKNIIQNLTQNQNNNFLFKSKSKSKQKSMDFEFKQKLMIKFKPKDFILLDDFQKKQSIFCFSCLCLISKNWNWSLTYSRGPSNS